MARGRCFRGWRRVALQEDNIRFVLHAFFMTSFCLLGALVFSNLEAGDEERQRAAYVTQLNAFLSDTPTVNISQLNSLLTAHAAASAAGFLNTSRARWDFAGSLYYVGTLVSTIGFGMTTARTPAGRLVSIAYGFVGCSGFLLFLNLFLERVITLTTFIMRWRRRRKRCEDNDDVISTCTPPTDVASIGSIARADSQGSQQSGSGSGSGGGEEEAWKPPVYTVMVVLFLAVVLVGCLSSLVYSYAEQWTYVEAFYFTFTLFATIGFGDYVPLQRRHYEQINAYWACNALIFVIGCSCMYSLFNVISIIIKQALNACVYWLSACCKRLAIAAARKRHGALPGLSHFWRRRNAIAPWPNTSKSHRQSADSGARNGRPGARSGVRRSSVVSGTVCNGGNISNGKRAWDANSQRPSGRRGQMMFSHQHGGGRGGKLPHYEDDKSGDTLGGDLELKAQHLFRMNQVSLAVLQKQLHDMAVARSHGGLVNYNHVIAPSTNSNSALKDGVGPLAMLDTKFGS